MTTYAKIVKGATKLKVAAPKPKYLEPILMATSMTHQVAPENFVTIMRTLNERLQDSSWSVVYKALLVIHIMIREGDLDVTLTFLADKAPNMLNLSRSNISRHAGPTTDVRYIMKYSRYLHTRVKHFADTKIDYVRDERVNNSLTQNGGRLRSLSVEKGLLRECESVQKQIDALLKNSFLEAEIKNDIVLTAFRLLVNDLLALFQELNEGVINLLEHYFEMFHKDAERALDVYKKFVDQTKYVIDYLRVAKHLEYATKLHVPTIKHAPTALTSSLEDYLNDPLFEQHRAEYLRSKNDKSATHISRPIEETHKQPSNAQPNLQYPFQSNPSQILTNSATSMSPSTLLVQQATFKPWGTFFPAVFSEVSPYPSDVNSVPTGSGFGNYGQTSIEQVQQTRQIQQMQQQQPIQVHVTSQQTGSNPFLVQTQPVAQQFTGFQSHTMPYNAGHYGPHTGPNGGLSRSNTNPFLQMTSSSPGDKTLVDPSYPFGRTRFANSHTTAFTFDSEPTPQKIDPSITGTNPFKVCDSTTYAFSSAAERHKSQVIKAQPTAGALEHLPTISVFPETRQEQTQNYHLQNARANLVSQATVNPQSFGQQSFQPDPQHSQSQWQPTQQWQQPAPHYNEPSLI